MRNRYIHHISKLALLCGFMISIASCEYQEIVDANYPDQKVYFPAAKNGRFVVNNVAATDQPYRYVADLSGRKLNIPLSVYRGGITTAGSFTVNIQVDNDTINSLITDGTLLNTELLAVDQHTIPASVQIADGAESAVFSVDISMDYLLANAGKQKALCLRISSSSVTTNPTLDKLILIIDPVMMFPVAGYQATPATADPKTIVFTNQSQYAVKYDWNFGDGGTSTEKSPTHKFAAAGTYEVTLIAEGVTGEPQRNAISKTIIIP